MELTGKYRHELKYSISLADRMALVQRLRPLMQRDPHTDETGRYTIRSVYFDNYKDKALREKLSGVQTREKFRIRYYNEDLSFITLEKKIKHNCKMKLQQLRPRVLVSYVREPYIYRAGNVRVTFDSHIRTSLFERDFAVGTLPDISATDAPGDTILEVKFDAFLPEVIRGLLQVGTLRQQAFSKYGACRRFG